jgi:NAD-dependent DNA ligase
LLIDGITAKVDDLRALMALGEFKSIKAAQASIGDGQKFKVVVTGDLNHWERDEFKNYIESLGHKMVGSVSSKTDLLITNTPNSGTVKNKRAAELGVRIVTELEAVEVMGLTLPGGGTSSQPVAHVPGETVDLDDM